MRSINETIRNFRNKNRIDIPNLINKHNSYKIHYITKIRNIIILVSFFLILGGLILFFILNNNKRKSKTKLSFKQRSNETFMEGYYIPKDNLISSAFKKCSVENCKRCYGNSKKDTCMSCIKSYKPITDKNNKIIFCEPNSEREEEKNKTLNNSENIIISTNIYENNTDNKEIIKEKSNYITDEIKTNIYSKNIDENVTLIETILKTEKIPDNEGTIKTKSTEIDPTIKFKLSNEIIKNNISENITELITQIKTDIEIKPTSILKITTENVVINCDPGYYYPEEYNTQQKCEKCSVIGCEICHGNTTINYCDSCFSTYFEKYVNNKLTCLEPDENCGTFNLTTFECLECKDQYFPLKGKCNPYYFNGTYYTNEDNQEIKLTGLDKYYFSNIVIDNDIMNTSISLFNYIMPKKGYHKVYYFMKNSTNSLQNLFYAAVNLVSVDFSSNFDTSNIINLKNMFRLCTSLISINLSNFYTSNVIDMSYMFSDCYNLTSVNLTKFSTLNARDMSGMFQNCNSVKYLDLKNFDVRNTISFSYMFHNCTSLISLDLNFSKSENSIISMNNMFSNCIKLTSAYISYINLNASYDLESMFSGCSSLLYFAISPYQCTKEKETMGIRIVLPVECHFYPPLKVLMDNMFKDCISLYLVDLANWGLYAMSMTNMFSNCISLTSINFGNIYIYNNYRIDYLFSNCTSLREINLTSIQVSNDVISMSHMFENCSSLEEVDLSSFNMSNVENIQFMFSGCSSLKNITFNKFSTNSLRNMSSLFSGCSSLSSINLKNFNTGNVIDMSKMFYNCSSINYLDLNSFDTSKVKYMEEMFFGCSNMKIINITSFNGTSLTSYRNMFKNANISMIIYTNYDFMLVIQSLYNN